MDVDTNYSTLLRSFKLLYDDLTKVPAEEYICLHQVATFVSAEIFDLSKPDECLLTYLQGIIEVYPEEIAKILRIALKMFADGFAFQKGSIFGFGPSADEAPDSVLKISSIDKNTLEKLDKSAQVHNILEERNVGDVNYELKIRGKENLHAVSRKVVLKKSLEVFEQVFLLIALAQQILPCPFALKSVPKLLPIKYNSFIIIIGHCWC